MKYQNDDALELAHIVKQDGELEVAQVLGHREGQVKGVGVSSVSGHVLAVLGKVDAVASGPGAVQNLVDGGHGETEVSAKLVSGRHRKPQAAICTGRQTG